MSWLLPVLIGGILVALVIQGLPQKTVVKPGRNGSETRTPDPADLVVDAFASARASGERNAARKLLARAEDASEREAEARFFSGPPPPQAPAPPTSPPNP